MTHTAAVRQRTGQNGLNSLFGQNIAESSYREAATFNRRCVSSLLTGWRLWCASGADRAFDGGQLLGTVPATSAVSRRTAQGLGKGVRSLVVAAARAPVTKDQW